MLTVGLLDSNCFFHHRQGCRRTEKSVSLLLNVVGQLLLDGVQMFFSVDELRELAVRGLQSLFDSSVRDGLLPTPKTAPLSRL